MATSLLIPVTGLYIVLLSVVLCERVEEGSTKPPTVDLYNEQACLSEGGICVLAVECPEGSLSNKTGLCPEQSQRGVECCHGVSINERRCRSFGGECVTFRCPKRLTMEKAEDCSKGEKCCVLV